MNLIISFDTVSRASETQRFVVSRSFVKNHRGHYVDYTVRVVRGICFSEKTRGKTRPRKYRNAGNKTIRPRSESRCRRGRLARSQSGDSLFSSGLHAFCKRWPLTSFENRTATEGDCMCKCNCVSKVIVYGSIKLYPSDGGRTVVVAEGRTGGEKRRGVTKRHVVSWRNR